MMRLWITKWPLNMITLPRAKMANIHFDIYCYLEEMTELFRVVIVLKASISQTVKTTIWALYFRPATKL